VIDCAVALLQCDPTLDRLDVVEHGLGLNRCDPDVASDQRIPSSPISLDRERHFGPPAQSRVEPPSQPFQKPLLTGIPDGIAGGVRTQPDVKSDRNSVRCELADGRTARACL